MGRARAGRAPTAPILPSARAPHPLRRGTRRRRTPDRDPP
uniref:Uncharacterized protein n=1 Tax=Arundo donax TaxID=35708 RepID=A0A0A9HKY8_ARUDO